MFSGMGWSRDCVPVLRKHWLVSLRDLLLHMEHLLQPQLALGITLNPAQGVHSHLSGLELKLKKLNE